ncbi:MAG: DUF503 domain-containing protein [Deltaproteobacteria bacterium]|nr:DUF503 domain-containing protein [Deltaproteobacteria bacterium]MBW2339463.1 DUF503 domain-containing protein [Deltaproteobacteria bacterium]
MVIGTLKLSLYIHNNHSLKEKRKVVKGIVARVRNKFNVSVAEVGSNDKWQMIELGISAVGNDRRFVNSSLDTILSFLESLYLGEIVDSSIEILNI